MSFAAFMDAALYHPEHGYYASCARRIGTDGADFFTASDAGEWFGRCLARQIAEFDGLLGGPDPFVVVEWGAGRGLLARDVRTALDAEFVELARRLEYVAVDRSAAMRVETAERAGVRALAPEDLPETVGPHCGCAVAVELFDALPVHRVRRRQGRLVEVAVGLDRDGSLCEVEVEPAAAVLDEAERWGLAPADGDEAEVGLDLAPTLARMSASLRRGFVIVIDYGHESHELRGGAHRSGTLLAYSRHRTSTDYLARAGLQDLTAHVPWSALVEHGQQLGLRWLGATTQDRFLVANGILEAFESPPGRHSDPEQVRARMRAMTLIHPEGMGRAFQVHVFAAGFESAPVVGGLADPFSR